MPSGFPTPFRHSGKEKKIRSLVGIVRTTLSLLCGWETFGFLLPQPPDLAEWKRRWWREKREKRRLCVHGSERLCVGWGGHLADECDGGVRGTVDESGVLWFASKPGMQDPTSQWGSPRSGWRHAAIWGPKDSSRVGALAPRVGALWTLEGRGGFGC